MDDTNAMVAIPAATVQIGAPEFHLDDIADQQHYARAWFDDETPQHAAHVGRFWIDRVPVTNIAYAAFVDATGYVTNAERCGYGLLYGQAYWHAVAGICWKAPAPGVDAVVDRPDHPVVHVDHADAATYAAWAGKRLPTEAQWEYAAHGPTWSAYPWGIDWDRGRANSAERYRPLDGLEGWRTWWQTRYAQAGMSPGTSPAGSFSPDGDSVFGVADMAGNVAEWTATTYQPYDKSRRYDPSLEAAMRHGYRVVRGGSWKHLRWQIRTTERIACVPTYSCFDVGFRCASNAHPNHQ